MPLEKEKMCNPKQAIERNKSNINFDQKQTLLKLKNSCKEILPDRNRVHFLDFSSNPVQRCFLHFHCTETNHLKDSKVLLLANPVNKSVSERVGERQKSKPTNDGKGNPLQV